jgi:hypothetical protein
MPGGPDPLYVAARHVLLDALEAIEPHLGALVLVGAQAVYLCAGEAGLAVAPYTTDADLALDPSRLDPEPLLEVSMERAGFRLLEGAVGIWQAQVDVEGVRRTVGVDLLVPASLGGPGRRAARIPPHARLTARKVAGLEGALVDRDLHKIGALDPADKRQFELMVAGPAALIVAKVHKIMDRERDTDRRSDKDALDVYRLLRVVPTQDLTQRFRRLFSHPLSRQTADTTHMQLPHLFGRVNSPGTQMAVRAAHPLESDETLAASLIALTQDLLHELPLI